jgi:hypothetical protein
MVAGVRPSLTSENANLASTSGQGVVAGGHQARAAAEGRAFDQGHGQGRDVVQGLEHVGQAQGVGAVVVLAASRRGHPVQVGARR